MSEPRYRMKIHTFGCKVNTYDTGLLQKRMRVSGYQLEESVEPGMVHVLNSCAVTGEATREALRLARRLRSRDPLATIVMTGCSAQVDGEVIDKVPGIDLVIANSHKGQLEALLDQYFKGNLKERVFRSNIFRKDDLEAGGGVEQNHTRTFLKIQDGCNSFCTYCVIPFARGKSRSLPMRDLIARVNDLAAQGISEVVLTGVHIGDYEDPTDSAMRAGPESNVTSGLATLVQNVLNKTEISRLRLSSLEPVELVPELLALYSNPRLCAHFHMSIQAAEDETLRLMRRNYKAADIEKALNQIAEQVPGAYVGMDVIAGFPGETQSQFDQGFELLARLPWTRLHVFPYSDRPGTKANALSDKVPEHIKNLRASRLRELSAQRIEKHAQAQVGTSKLGLVLKGQTKSVQVKDDSTVDASSAGQAHIGNTNGHAQASQSQAQHSLARHSHIGHALSRDYWPIEIVDVDENWVETNRGKEQEFVISAARPLSSGIEYVLEARPLVNLRKNSQALETRVGL